ncbi:hypothetical protein P153DRAFT_386990 [Dothidotthia symphoricarpi CBS 119687]|uniref:Uncharacterized protein n=1 Tax=Dothidotthia symphoricarpi CBS 119687 TaxID=1392245 RepID=A0A6A6AAX7_9PLEO|nr:uncharacterized protein P153DRAFT_386990 [Dothidotthia symphoricarpi CBS 119687]KAF2128017.1 hypothetical protein P153DRAFT_386990 [Dothidotthia symphoricarpi CBS 119687]
MSGILQKSNVIATRSYLRSICHTTTKSKDVTPISSRASSQPKSNHPAEEPSLPSFSLLQQIREARPATRYTVYAGLGLMAAVETTFWLSVARAKFFPATSEEAKQHDAELLERIRGAIKGYRQVWMRNYGRYYGAYQWGLEYGGLDGLENKRQ